MTTIKESVNLARDEVLLREYQAIDKQFIPFFSAGVKGRIAVTNKRIIGQCETTVLGGQYTELNSVPLEKVEGVNLATGFRISWILFIIGALFTLFCIIALAADHNFVAPKVIFLIIGIVLFISSFRRQITIGVRVAYIGKRGLISRPDIEGYLLLFTSGFRVFSVNGPDADAVMKGLDATIIDIKERGGTVIQDLKCPNSECKYMTTMGEKPPKHCPECGKSWGEK
jgi:hypothetical protein